MKYRSCFSAVKNIGLGLVFGFMGLAAFNVHAETVYYTLDNVILDDDRQMTGTFSWTYDAGDFENGTGQFVSLEIPWTSHNQDDLNATFDIGSSIEITLEGSVHDDGVDITLFLLQPLTPSTSSPIDLDRSKYEIGGNGFHTGVFQNGSILPPTVHLSFSSASPGFITLSWEQDVQGYVLQETQSLTNRWADSASGGTNPVVVPVTAPTMFYRLAIP